MTGSYKFFLWISGTTVTLAGTSYDFTNTELANGRVISENNDLLIFKQEIDSLGGFHMLLSGTNIDGMGTGTTDVDRVDFIHYLDDGISITPTANNPNTTVNYSGNYIAAREGSTTIPLSQGTFTMAVSFTSDLFSATMTGQTRNSANTVTGNFSNATLANMGGNINFGVSFIGADELSGVVISNVNGNFLSSNTEHATGLVAAGSGAMAQNNSHQVVLGIMGSRTQN